MTKASIHPLLPNTAWAMLPSAFHEAVAMLNSIDFARQSHTAPIRSNVRARAAAPTRQGSYGSVAVIPILGVISARPTILSQIFGLSSLTRIAGAFRQALADPSVKAIVFDIDSPGGGVDGVLELADEILRARAQKPSVAVANSMAASAAYWLASAAGELVVTPSGAIGSIGVFCEHEDISGMLDQDGIKVSLIGAGKYKTDGNPYEALSESARSDIQSRVNGFYDMFVKSVAAGRKTSTHAVKTGFGEGRMVLAGRAVREGMADRIATLDQTVARLFSAPNATGTQASTLELQRHRLALSGNIPKSSFGKPVDQLLRELEGRDA